MAEPAARVHCFFDVAISGREAGRIVFEVRALFSLRWAGWRAGALAAAESGGSASRARC